MNAQRFAPAEAALKAGRLDEAISLMVGEIAADPVAPAQIYRNIGGILFRHQRFAEAEQITAAGIKQHPRDPEIWNLRGVALRRLSRQPEALKALDKAAKLAPKNASVLQNRGNVLNDLRDPGAIQVFTNLVRAQPSSHELNRSLGRAYWFAEDLDKAETRFNLAIKLKPDYEDAWLDLSTLAMERADNTAAVPVLERAIAIAPDSQRLAEAYAIALRRSGRYRDAEERLLAMLAEKPDSAWLHFHIGGVISDYDRPRANDHYEKAVALEPGNVTYVIAKAESLARSRHGDEAAHVEAAYQALKAVLGDLPDDAGSMKVAYEINGRLADYDAVDQLGDFSSRGRRWAESGRHTAFLIHLADVRTPEDRHELVEHHLIWGRKALAAAGRRPLVNRGPRTPNGKIRIGFMSSDLRAHPVAYFALPLFEHYDRSRFEVYCYSFFQGEEDGLQKRITDWVDGFRWVKDVPDHEVAQMIADDQLDMLIELGGSTHMNKLGVMAFKPAPLSASWLGYPHSAGLESIDHFILDPYVVPPDRSLVIEEPLLMPKSWIAMGELAFRERPVAEVIPEVRNGYITIGTANNPYKYSRDMLRGWARVMAAIPDSRFLFIRPEGNAPSFRRNIVAQFEAEGISPERVQFEAVRGAHMPFYNELDFSLDTFPQTGGTTTCEALFMGVPVITKVGAAVFERLSYSILSNAGLGDLCAHSDEEFLQIALKLAADRPRREALHQGLRAQLKASPLGQTQQFSVDFYEMLERAVNTAKANGKIPQAAA